MEVRDFVLKGGVSFFLFISGVRANEKIFSILSLNLNWRLKEIPQMT